MDKSKDEEWGMYDGQCVACDVYGRVNDLGLCMDCADQLERDLVRERDWEYSASAFLLSDKDREELRQQIIREHGKNLELIEPRRKPRPKRHPRFSRGDASRQSKQ